MLEILHVNQRVKFTVMMVSPLSLVILQYVLRPLTQSEHHIASMRRSLL